MARYLITLQPHYRGGVLYQPGEECTIPDDVQPPKGAQPLDEVAEKWCSQIASKSLEMKADALEKAAAALREKAAKGVQVKKPEPKAPEAKPEPKHGVVNGLVVPKQPEHKDAQKQRPSDKSPV